MHYVQVNIQTHTVFLITHIKYKCINNFHMLGNLFLIGTKITSADHSAQVCRLSVFSLSECIMDVELKIKEEMFVNYYVFNRNFIYDIIILIRIYTSNLVQILR